MLKKLSPVLLMLFGHQGTNAAQLHAPNVESNEAQTKKALEDADDGLDEESFLVTNTEIMTTRMPMKRGPIARSSRSRSTRRTTVRTGSSSGVEAMKGNNDTDYRGK